MHATLPSQKLCDLPRLSRDNALVNRAPCKICGGAAELFDVVDFNKVCSTTDFYAFGLSGIAVHYRRCSSCGFMFTDFFDSWRREDFAKWIYNDDYPLVDDDYRDIRPKRFSEEMGLRLRGLESTTILDYGSGAGAFSEQMRLTGFRSTADFDPFSSPQRPNDRFDLVTCFEVLEHSTDPFGALSDMKSFLRPGACILFSQTLQPSNILELRGNWWYAAPRNGHVSLFTTEALARLAMRTGLVFCGTDGLLLFRTAQSSSVTDRLFSEIRPCFTTLHLLAPNIDEGVVGPATNNTQWNGIESLGEQRFRWSASPKIDWALPPAPFYPCEYLLSIPLCMLSYPSVLDGASIGVGDQRVPISVSSGEIRARIPVAGPEIRQISLFTGEPCTPARMRGESDQRSLGVAIFAAN